MRMFLLWPLLFAALVAACAKEIEEEIGECEPGVGDISQCVEVAPPSV